ncbi:DNA-binding domain-containing protein [Hydromonas duriensis]|uniref:Putative DNA-binding protein n=1 Tax=Hydromonas duriensis TaxID=1527608 RepID=A0A4R6Y8R1_9BURK|nr:DNA-binding domain-containing protein [Hydromonas duriensis]TDR31802.1 putative DNA-binding protein [Hydromonas duriensis]
MNRMLLSDWQNDLQQSILSNTNQLQSPVNVGHIPQAQRLAVYQHAYIARLEEALRANYPMLHQLLGDDDFSTLHKRYVLAHPPEHASIRWYGEALAVFLSITKPYSEIPIFSELAQFDWAIRHSIDAANAERLSASDLKRLSAEQWLDLELCLHPSVTLFEFNWNVVPVWQALSQGSAVPSPEAAQSYWLVWRDETGMTQWLSANQLMFQTLSLIKQHSSFIHLCDAISKDIGTTNESEHIVAQVLYQCVEYKILCMSNTHIGLSNQL